jgi:hypothetical protein
MQAVDFAKMDKTRAIVSFFNIKNSFESEKDTTLQLVAMEARFQFTDTEFDADEVKQYLRHKALAKLSADEIEALGVGSLAVYDKLKHHGVDQ